MFRALFLSATAAALLGAVSTAPARTQVVEVRLWDNLPASSEGIYEQRGTPERSNRWLHGVADPVLRVHLPEDRSEPRAAVVIYPGGGYSGQAIDKEGNYVAQWLAERGLVGIVVPYRCGGGTHQHPVPLSDAKRAIRLVRDRADEWGIEATRIGVMGFSAGGHLAASAAVSADRTLDGVTDSLAPTSDQADFAILVYPVISMRDGVGHNGSRRKLLGDDPDEELVRLLSADEQVRPTTPPTLLIHSYDDRVVSIENPLRFAAACRAKGVPVEAHYYETGGHGYGMWADEGAVAGWPEVLERWLVARGLMNSTK